MRRAALAFALTLAAVGVALVPLGGCDGAETCDAGVLLTDDVVVGTGPTVVPSGYIQVSYTGRLASGAEFTSDDSTIFFLPELIPGFRQGVLGMQEGGQRTITIPPALAYGADGAVDGNGDVIIPPCETLTFSVTLLRAYPATCPSGTFEAEDLVVGTGAEATDSSRVRLSYTGRLADGTEFDDGDGVTLNLPAVIAGFRDGVDGMRVGGRRRVTVPPNLAYGPTGRRSTQTGQFIVPPCETLTFEIELLEVLSNPGG